MKRMLLLLAALLLAGCAQRPSLPPAEPTVQIQTQPPQPETLPTLPTEPALAEEDFVQVNAYIPEIFQDLRYAGENNFTGQVIYAFSDAYLRWGTVKKLQAVSRELGEQGLGLKIWDGFRPVSAQFRLWQVCPDPAYVANPEKGYSSHSRGNTVDITLVDSQGRELEMPTDFDDFSPKADRDYSDCTEQAAANARLLEQVMEKHGFTGYAAEWWHFTDTQSYPVDEVFAPPVHTE